MIEGARNNLEATFCSVEVQNRSEHVRHVFVPYLLPDLCSAAISKVHIEIKTAVVEGASVNEALYKILRAVLNGLKNKLISTARSTWNC